MALSNVEKKVGVTVTVDASQAVKGWNAYKKGADDAKKSTQDLEAEEKKIRRAIDERSKHMQAAARHQAGIAREAAAAAAMQAAKSREAGEAFKRQADENIAFMGKLALGAGTAAFAIDQMSQRAMASSNVLRNQKFSIDGVRESTLGLVDDMTLMRLSVQAQRYDVAKNAEQMAELGDIATKLGLSVGRDATDSIERLTQGIGKQEQELLDELGVVVRAQEAYDRYAEAHGVAADSLTQMQKRQAFNTLAMERAREAAANVTVETEGAHLSIQRAKVAMINATDAALRWGFSISDSVTPAIKDFAVAASGSKGFIDIVTTLGDAREEEVKGNEALAEFSKTLGGFVDKSTGAVGPVTRLTQAMAEMRARFEGWQAKDVIDGLAASLKIVNDELLRQKGVATFQAQAKLNMEAQVHQLDKEILALKGVKGFEAQIAALQEQRVDLLKEEAALRGDIYEVVRLIRKEELDAMKPETKSRGGKVDRFAAERKAFEAQLAASHRHRGLVDSNRDRFTQQSAFDSGLGDAKNFQAMQEAQRQHNEALIQGETDKNNRILAERQRALEVAVANGLDPAVARQREADAQVSFNENELASLRQHHAEKEQLAMAEDRLKDARHRQELARMAAEVAARKKMIANYVGANEIMNQLAQGSIGLGMEVVAASERSERAKAEIANKMMAGQAFGIGALETVKAAAAFASLNPIQGGMHTAAAALAFAKGGLLASGTIGPMATVGEGSSSINAGGGAGGSSSGPSGSSNAPKGPISRKDDGMQGAHHAPPGGGSSGNVVVHASFHSVLPADEEKAGIQIANLLRHSQQSFGSAA